MLPLVNSSIEPETKKLVPLFNPRTDLWDERFDLEGPLIVGLNSVLVLCE